MDFWHENRISIFCLMKLVNKISVLFWNKLNEVIINIYIYYLMCLYVQYKTGSGAGQSLCPSTQSRFPRRLIVKISSD